MTAAPNAAVSSALPLAIPLPSTASILNAIDPSLPPPSPIQQPRTVRLLTHQLMKTIAALTDSSSIIITVRHYPCSSHPHCYRPRRPYICPSETIIFGHTNLNYSTGDIRHLTSSTSCEIKGHPLSSLPRQSSVGFDEQ
jgi:hypothetical protein